METTTFDPKTVTVSEIVAEGMRRGEKDAIILAAKESFTRKHGVYVYTTWTNSYYWINPENHDPKTLLESGFHYKFYVDFSHCHIDSSFCAMTEENTVDWEAIELPSYKIGETVELLGGYGKWHEVKILDIFICQTKDSDREYLFEHFGRFPCRYIRKIAK